MQREFICERLARAQRRLAHCERFIERQTLALEDSRLAGNAIAEQLVRQSILLALRVRLARDEELQKWKDLSVAS